MSESSIRIDITEWINRVDESDPSFVRRQVTQIILHAVATSSFLSQHLYLKGGVLMGLAYRSPRQTVDIDFTASKDYQADHETSYELRRHLNDQLNKSVATLGFTDFVLKVQSVKELPRKRYPNANFPALAVKIGYARRNTAQEKQLNQGFASIAVGIDITFNEFTNSIQSLELTTGDILLAYSLSDVIAEKYCALLGQSKRNRYRRQDVFDLDMLILKPNVDAAQILETLFKKSEPRNLFPNSESFNDPELKRRAATEWDSLQFEISDVPDFEACFARVKDFYSQLPW